MINILVQSAVRNGGFFHYFFQTLCRVKLSRLDGVDFMKKVCYNADTFLIERGVQLRNKEYANENTK